MKKYLSEIKIVFSILPSQLKKRMRLMLTMLSISGFLESLTIGLFIPLIAIISEKKTKNLKNNVREVFRILEIIDFA